MQTQTSKDVHDTCVDFISLGTSGSNPGFLKAVAAGVEVQMSPRVSERGALICLRGIIQEHLDRCVVTSIVSHQSCFSE